MAIPPEIIEEVRQRSSLYQVATEFTELKKSGKEYSGCCPFHKEKTPSFYVNDEEGLFNCFGCGKHGSLFDFVMELRRFSFPEAVRYLASRVGVEIKETSKFESAAVNARKLKERRLRAILQVVENHYRTLLADKSIGGRAQEYLKGRGLTSQTAAAFSVGYAKARSSDLLAEITSWSKDQELFANVSESEIRQLCITAGILRESSEENRDAGQEFYEFFRDRIIFPIHRSDGQPVAFGGRILESKDNAPKYINSSETPVYVKRQTLYGIAQAIDDLRQKKHAYICEGYVDVLSMYQHGFRPALATCGTALTEEHVRVLKRFVNRISIVFDGDVAGRKAAARTFPLFLNSGIEAVGLLLPDGEDPDSLLRSRPVEEVRGVFERSERPLIDVYVEEEIAQAAIGSDGVVGAVTLGKVAKQVATVLARVSNSVEKEILLARASDKLRVSVESLRPLMSQSNTSSESGESNQSYQPAPQYFGRSGFSKRNNYWRSDQTFKRKESLPPISKSASAMDVVSRQLLVALIAEPALSQVALEMPSLFSGEEDSLNLPPEVVEAINHFSQEELVGCQRLLSEEALLADECGKITDILEALALPGKELVQECLRQLRLGQVTPSALLSDVSRTIERSRLAQKHRDLRHAETRAVNELDRVKIIQEKLERRRALEKFRLESSDS